MAHLQSPVDFDFSTKKGGQDSLQVMSEKAKEVKTLTESIVYPTLFSKRNQRMTILDITSLCLCFVGHVLDVQLDPDQHSFHVTSIG